MSWRLRSLACMRTQLANHTCMARGAIHGAPGPHSNLLTSIFSRRCGAPHSAPALAVPRRSSAHAHTSQEVLLVPLLAGLGRAVQEEVGPRKRTSLVALSSLALMASSV